MAKGIKTGGRDFQKGVSGNPKGPTPIPEDLKIARALTRIEFEQIGSTFVRMSADEMKARLSDPSSTLLERMVGAVCIEAIKKGDHQRLNFLLDRLIGKVAEKIEGKMTFQNEAEMAKLAAMNDEELVSYVQQHAKGLLPQGKE